MLVAYMLLSAVQPVFAEIGKRDIEKAIDIKNLKHPYLYFSAEDIPAMRERIARDQEASDIMARLLAEGNRLMYTPVDHDIPKQGRNTRADWTEEDRDNKYEDYYFNNRENAFTMAFLYQITGEEKYAQKSFEFADALCDMQSWTLRAHEFPIIYSRIMPWGVDDDQVCFNFDHWNGDTARIMAAVYDWLHPALTIEQRDRLRGALIEKVVTSVRGDWEYHWWAWAYRCNWCGVCCSGVGLTGLALLTEDPHLTDIIAEAYNRINNMLNELGVDGGWQEGGGYWNYAVHTSTFFADALKRASNGKYNLFKNERLSNNTVNFPIFISVPGRGILNFEDSGAGRLGSTHLINKLAAETGNPEVMWYRENFYKGESSASHYSRADIVFDIIWPVPDIKARAPETTSKHFRTINWWTMRSNFFDTSKLFVAGKAGKNDDPHHGHLDIGQFTVYWHGKAYIRDIGSGSYDQEYFDDVRWDYPQASSVGHNVVFVNGEKQIPGKMRRQPWNYDVGGDVLDWRTSDTLDYVLMDPTKAYPGEHMKGWRRHVILDKDDDVVVVLDEVKSAKGAEVEVRFHAGVDREIVGDSGITMLKDTDGTMALIPVYSGNYVIRPGRHACQPVNATRNFFWVPYFGTVVSAPSTETVISHIAVPVDGEADAKAIAASASCTAESNGNMTVAFSKGGRNYSYTYEKQKDGLLLKK